MPLTAGTRLGPYEVLELIGAEGMGSVYRARDPRLGREVAIKVLQGDFAHRPDHLARFEREARAVAALTTRTSSASTTSGRRASPMEPRYGNAGAPCLQCARAPRRRPISVTTDESCS